VRSCIRLLKSPKAHGYELELMLLKLVMKEKMIVSLLLDAAATSEKVKKNIMH
jgi:hypothetical protein